MDDTRIPLEEFEDFATCRLVGQQFGIRYQAFNESFDASMADPVRKQERAPWPRQQTIARRGREPRKFTDLEQAFGEPNFAATPWGGRIE